MSQVHALVRARHWEEIESSLTRLETNPVFILMGGCHLPSDPEEHYSGNAGANTRRMNVSCCAQ